MTAPSDTRARGRGWYGPAAVFCVVLVAELWLIRAAGTDIPFYDQWSLEGQRLYPSLVDGTFRPADLVSPGNENRIAWTLLLDVVLFRLNSDQWDPLVQMMAGSVLRALCAFGVAKWLGSGLGRRGRILTALGVAIAFLPQLAWHNVLWGIETHAFFVLGFALLTFASSAWTDDGHRSRMALTVLFGAAGLIAMAPGSLIPLPLLALALLHAVERRKLDARLWRELVPAGVLLALALWWRVKVPQHENLHPASLAQLLAAAGRALAWPHVAQPWAAVVLNLPLAVAVGSRLSGRRTATRGEDFALLAGGWAFAVALAIGWARGGGVELSEGVPSRYVDFLVLLPLANAWCAVVLAFEYAGRRRVQVRAAAGVWLAFLLIGWLGLSTEMMRNIILPRSRDRDAPVRLAVAFQRSGDPSVFAGQPRLYVPAPELGSVWTVLRDPRLQGKLPPSFQPDRPAGPLSRATRCVLGRD